MREQSYEREKLYSNNDPHTKKILGRSRTTTSHWSVLEERKEDRRINNVKKAIEPRKCLSKEEKKSREKKVGYERNIGKKRKYSDEFFKKEKRSEAKVSTPSNQKRISKKTDGSCEQEKSNNYDFKQKLQSADNSPGTMFFNSTPCLRTGKYAQIVKDLHLVISDETYQDIAANLPYFEKKYKNMTEPPIVSTAEPMFSDMRILSDWDSDSQADHFQDSYFENYTNKKM